MNGLRTRSVVACGWVLIEGEHMVEEGKTIKICVCQIVSVPWKTGL